METDERMHGKVSHIEVLAAPRKWFKDANFFVTISTNVNESLKSSVEHRSYIVERVDWLRPVSNFEAPPALLWAGERTEDLLAERTAFK